MSKRKSKKWKLFWNKEKLKLLESTESELLKALKKLKESEMI